jgi:AraC-like DNA-binding protein
VRRPRLKPLAIPPRTAGAMTRLVCALLRAKGIALAPLVARSGLTEQQIDDRDARIAVKHQIKMLDLAAAALHDDLIGFHLARDSDLREVALLYYVLASSNRLGESLERAERYSSLNNEGIHLRIRHDDASTVITLSYVDVERRLDRHQMECWLTAVVRVCRLLTDRQLIPRHVRVDHLRADAPAELKSFFGCNVTFGCDADEIVFAENVQNLPVVDGDPYLNEILVKFCEDAISRRGVARNTLRAELEKTIAPLLPHGKAHAGEVARRLGMSRRTLARRLASEGLTFAQLLADLRVDLAKRHLRDGHLPISEIAWLIGYGEASAFTHAFKRATGKTPREFRMRDRS